MIRRPSQIIRSKLTSLVDEDHRVYHSQREFLLFLEQRGDLKRIKTPVSPAFEITEICHRTIKQAGPALLFENPTAGNMPVVANLYGTEQRVAATIGLENAQALREFGKQMAKRLVSIDEAREAQSQAAQKLDVSWREIFQLQRNYDSGKVLP
ncbi:hypothetical protein LCGC14_3165170 [marine sediment metagenome]|uniref:3-octaprenyl-4-hydroxybenzoate carboxy-lyase-like N-terminal domain-containing protein n=1 Tax=marine sediment metagenome TaxID=412755 RepID=A0A0F8WC03_9ZZZZ